VASHRNNRTQMWIVLYNRI